MAKMDAGIREVIFNPNLTSLMIKADREPEATVVQVDALDCVGVREDHEVRISWPRGLRLLPATAELVCVSVAPEEVLKSRTLGLALLTAVAAIAGTISEPWHRVSM